MRNLMKLAALAGAAFTALSIGTTGANAVVLESNVYGHDANGPGYTNLVIQQFGFTSTTAPVNHTIAMPSAGPTARSSHFGAASAAQGTLRAAADLRVNSRQEGPNASAKTESSFYKEVMVGPGTSGLLAGAPIRLDLALRLDGTARAGFINRAPVGSGLIIPLDYRVLTRANISFRYRIEGPVRQVCDPFEGCYEQSDTLADLSSFGNILYDYQGTDGGDTLEAQLSYGWGAFTNVGAYPGLYVNDYDYLTGLSGPPGNRGYSLDTGLLALQFDTFVGETLFIDGDMDIFLQAYAYDDADLIAITASSLGDFASTFDAELSSSVAGIVLDGELPGVYLASTQTPVTGVPEPITLSLLGAGLGGIGLMRRRGSLPL